MITLSTGGGGGAGGANSTFFGQKGQKKPSNWLEIGPLSGPYLVVQTYRLKLIDSEKKD